MKRISILVFCFAFILGFSGVAASAPYTWTDYIDFTPDLLVPPTATYYHNIADDGFSSEYMGGNDTIDSYDLTVEIYDDNNPTYRKTFFGTIQIPDGGEVASIWTLGGVYSYDFSLTEMTYTSDPENLLELGGVLDILDDGTLNVAIASLWGDFYVASSTLSAYGDNGTAPVPEPATMLLLGTGLVGLAVGSRKKIFKKK